MMRDIRPMPPAIDTGRLATLAGAAVSTLGHWRLWGLTRPGIAPLVPGPAVAGTAVTLALPGADSVLLHETLDLLRPGDVLVIDRLGDTRHACVGGIVARAALAQGASAIVVDGPVTDIAELRNLGLPIWCRGLSGMTTRRLGLGGRRNTPVCIGGATIEAGDALLCDEDGIAAIAPAMLDEELQRLTAHAGREALIIDGLARGETLTVILARLG
ncbi:RraA family protein [Polymorphobacter sp.]|uniref:RraA family protein n=1 Tax=Polymorphobacter sp. TaxID=1909290 RepID=UPI003F6FF3AC